MALTPATVASMTPYEAARRLRVMLRDAKTNEGQKLVRRNETDYIIQKLEESVTIKTSKEGLKLRAQITNLRNYLESERSEVVNLDIPSAYLLVQHIPTAKGLPSTEKMETTIRGIAAMLKHSGVSFTNLESPYSNGAVATTVVEEEEDEPEAEAETEEHEETGDDDDAAF